MSYKTGDVVERGSDRGKVVSTDDRNRIVVQWWSGKTTTEKAGACRIIYRQH